MSLQICCLSTAIPFGSSLVSLLLACATMDTVHHIVAEKKKKTRRRLRLSCVECTKRRQVRKFNIRAVILCIVANDSNACLSSRNATATILALYVSRATFLTSAAGRTSPSHVLLQRALHISLGLPPPTARLPLKSCKRRSEF